MGNAGYEVATEHLHSSQLLGEPIDVIRDFVKYCCDNLLTSFNPCTIVTAGKGGKTVLDPLCGDIYGDELYDQVQNGKKEGNKENAKEGQLGCLLNFHLGKLLAQGIHKHFHVQKDAACSDEAGNQEEYQILD